MSLVLVIFVVVVFVVLLGSTKQYTLIYMCSLCYTNCFTTDTLL